MHMKIAIHFVWGKCQSLLILFLTLQLEESVYQEIANHISGLP